MKPSVAVIGSGFTGLAAARDLARAGHPVTVIEADGHVGGLAGAFQPDENVEAEPLDRFYHHWFTSDLEVMALIRELGLEDAVATEASLTGVYYNRRITRLSTPLDLLRFTALPPLDRLRLGWLALRARRVKDWRPLEHLTAAQWLRSMAGERVYRVMWEPLLQGKFGRHADAISAVWIWNKLKLRGGSRAKSGAEQLVYVRGSFARLAEAICADIQAHGGRVKTHSAATELIPLARGGWEIRGPWGSERAARVIATTAPPILADLIDGWAAPHTLASLRRINYLANICLVLVLDRSLSSTYWLNVNDPGFPFVGVIEHTRFQSPAHYGGRHIVYLSRYLPQDDPLLDLCADDFLHFAIPHVQRMFPAFDQRWIQRHHVWRALWAQPIVERHYSQFIPPVEGLAPDLYLCSMAQIYPEDRGTNYAIRAGRDLAARLIAGG
ncbi:NAD(P)/FAD-dependent oxidoreductase [Parahaliea mediterranea]|uniref:NAD(P)/FAD-dependent oxidoreductase n=1 Tax=Parahaliea mediterranea TaxID=651086 RepID=UPI000E2ED991|nr:NAD(P)/FAD-dependent oxidoreductase [Parahaliea mediterranea]